VDNKSVRLLKVPNRLLSVLLSPRVPTADAINSVSYVPIEVWPSSYKQYKKRRAQDACHDFQWKSNPCLVVGHVRMCYGQTPYKLILFTTLFVSLREKTPTSYTCPPQVLRRLSPLTSPPSLIHCPKPSFPLTPPLLRISPSTIFILFKFIIIYYFYFFLLIFWSLNIKTNKIQYFSSS